MACDSAYNHTGGWQFQGGPKMLELSKEVAEHIFSAKKAIIGGAGDASSLGNAWEWLTDPSQKPPRLKNSVEFVALTSNGLYTSFNLINWIAVDQKYYAIGSGMNFAAGALASGKSAVKAVEIAMKWDPSTNFQIYEYKL
jgi:hypothetical protein